MKKSILVVLCFLFVFGTVYAQTATSVGERSIAEFRRQDTSVTSDVRITSQDRSWQDQLRIILGSAPSMYPNIKRNFLSFSGLSSLPTLSEVNADRSWLGWWEREIMAQAGLPNGFAHVGGRAVDISVRSLNNEQKAAFERILRNNGMRVTYEFWDGSRVVIVDSISRANLFHCFY